MRGRKAGDWDEAEDEWVRKSWRGAARLLSTVGLFLFFFFLLLDYP
jgi:hypothetical protein